MTKLEAQVYFPVNDFEEVEELYEEKLFELKQFLISHLPTSKLSNSKLKQFSRFSLAYYALGGVEPCFEESTQNELVFPEDLKKAVSLFYQQESRIKLNLNLSQGFDGVSYHAKQLVNNLLEYAKCWRLDDGVFNLSPIKMSDVPNQMDLLEAVKQFNQEGRFTFNEILTLPDDNLLMKESIRLSLWLKFERNV